MQWHDNEEAPTDNQPPVPSIEEMERRLLGLLIRKPELYDDVIGQLQAHQFHFDIHSELFAEFERQIKAGITPTDLTMMDSIPNRPIRNNTDQLHDYIMQMWTAANEERGNQPLNYVPFIIRHYGIRSAAAQTAELDRLSFQGKPDLRLAEFFTKIDDLRLEVMDSGIKQKPKTIGEAATTFVEDLGRRICQPDGDDGRVLTGLHTIDNLMKGFGEGDLIVIAGRPGMGKTTLATCIVRHVAQRDHGAALFSFEMAERQVTARMMSDLLKQMDVSVPYNALLAPNLAMKYADWESCWEQIKEAEAAYKQLPIELDTSSSMTLGELMARSRKTVRNFRKKNLKRPIIVIDYLKFIKASSRYAGNRVHEVGEITGGLKGLAKELEVPIFLLCQLNRIVEGRQEKRPTLSDLRDSGEIEQDADVVMFTYRPHYYTKEITKQNDLYLLVEKHRNGETGELLMSVDMRFSHIYEKPTSLDHY